jgi:hypothetical protein
LGLTQAKLQKRYETPSVFPVDELLQSYVAATRQGLSRTKEALEALRSVAPGSAFEAELPPISDLTPLEKLFHPQTSA